MNTNEKLLVIVKHALENNDAIRLMELSALFAKISQTQASIDGLLPTQLQE